MDESKGKVFLHHRVRIILTVTIQNTIAVCTLNCCCQVNNLSDCSFIYIPYLHTLFWILQIFKITMHNMTQHKIYESNKCRLVQVYVIHPHITGGNTSSVDCFSVTHTWNLQDTKGNNSYSVVNGFGNRHDAHQTMRLIAVTENPINTRSDHRW